MSTININPAQVYTHKRSERCIGERHTHLSICVQLLISTPMYYFRGICTLSRLSISSIRYTRRSISRARAPEVQSRIFLPSSASSLRGGKFARIRNEARESGLAFSCATKYLLKKTLSRLFGEILRFWRTATESEGAFTAGLNRAKCAINRGRGEGRKKESATCARTYTRKQKALAY